MEGRRKTWYFMEPESKLRDFYNMLHVPYTAMALSFVLAGAALAPLVHPDRLAATLVAYFFGLGIGAHAVDQLEPSGSHYVEKLSGRDLLGLALLGFAISIAIGTYYAITVTLWLVPLIAAGFFFAIAYPLPSRVADGLFHNNLTFAFSWGFLPFMTSYFVNSEGVGAVSVAGGITAALAAGAEIRLSRRARAMRKGGMQASDFRREETLLKTLVASTCTVSLAMVLFRVYWG